MASTREVEVGRRVYTPVDLALFSAATWNPHLIHLSADAAATDGLDGTVVQSHFLPATLLALLDRAETPYGTRLHAISWRNRAPVLPGQEVVFILADTANAGEWDWTAAVAGKPVAEGTVVLAGPHEGEGRHMKGDRGEESER